jgi:AcrR family transcriptional regulator
MRMTREQSRAHTRDRLLTAARGVFARSGFHGASVEEIASEAGFSTGALYSNFDGKEDLFLALMEREIDEHAREIAEAVREQASIAERATGGARRWMTMIEREPELLLLFMEFWAYGVRDPNVRPKVAQRFAQMRSVLTQLIADGVRDFQLELALPAEQLAIAIDALADGIARQKLADPGAVPDELMGTVLALLFAAVTRPAGGRSAPQS